MLPVFDGIGSGKVGESFGLDRSFGSGFLSIPVIPDPEILGCNSGKFSSITIEYQEEI
jgi:hypothetical protein